MSPTLLPASREERKMPRVFLVAKPWCCISQSCLCAFSRYTGVCARALASSGFSEGQYFPNCWSQWM